MLKDFSVQSLFMGCLVAFVGFASTFAVVLHGMKGVGASEAQAASGLMALSIAMGVCGLLLSAITRKPLSVAWSTPGAALLVTAGVPEGGYSAAVGAFIMAAVLLIAAGLFRPIGRAIAAIPSAVANAMLAGVLITLCFAPVKAVGENPWLGLPIVLAWLIAGRFNRLLAVPAALAAFVLVLIFGVEMPADALSSLSGKLMPEPHLIAPVFTLAGFVSIALPLFIVTMASQNIPGIAVLKVNGYTPEPGPLFTATGIGSLLAAPFGAIPINMAAITAAMCAGEDAHHDPARRYWAGMIAGIGYILFGLAAGAVTALVSLAPPILIEAVAGLALVGAFSASALAAFKDVETREAAAVTFLVSAAGIPFGGVSAAFWGLICGLLVLGLGRLLKR